EYVNECYATTAEIIAACSAIVPYQGLHVSHIRYPLGIIEALKEVVEISRKSKAPLHVSHLKGSTKDLSEEIIQYIDSYAVHEVDFSFDVYPYSSASTMLQYLLPYEVWEQGPLRAKKKVLDMVILEK